MTTTQYSALWNSWDHGPSLSLSRGDGQRSYPSPNILLLCAADQAVVSTDLLLLLGKKEPRYMVWQERARNVVFLKRKHLTSHRLTWCYLHMLSSVSTLSGPIAFPWLNKQPLRTSHRSLAGSRHSWNITGRKFKPESVTVLRSSFPCSKVRIANATSLFCPNN